jgi:hypothetical protein
MLHNWHLGLKGMDELHDLAKHFADCIVPQEYGVDRSVIVFFFKYTFDMYLFLYSCTCVYK